MRKYIVFAAAFLAIVLCVGPAFADNDLHDKDTLMTETDGCAGCHRAHTAQGPKLLKEGATQDQFCFTCHDGSGAETDVVDGVLVGQPNPPGTDPTQYGNGDDGDGNPLRGGGFAYATMDTNADGVLEVGVEVTSTHSASGTVSGTMWGSGPINGGESDYGITVELKCGDCHNPHGNGNYRILRGNPDGMEDEGNTTAVDVADEITKNYEVTFIAGNGTSQYYRDVSYVPDNLDDWCAQCHTRYSAGGGAGNTDSGDIVFTYRHNTVSLSGGCLKCHVAHGTSATMGTYSGAVTFPDGTTQGLIPDEESRLLSNSNRKVCAPCHTSAEGTVGGHGGDGDCGVCHGASGSHATHTTSNSKGPATPLDCSDCHNASYSGFSDGQGLAATTVCDTCHSPGGIYDGVDDPVIGAKPNWDSGVYSSPTLQSGKEQWCVGCHDDGTSVIDSVSAPNTELFYTSGHGMAGADVECLDCHDTTFTHIDGIARTYVAPEDIYAPEDYYQVGYRLKSVGVEPPMIVPYRSYADPETGIVPIDGFRLCFDCHTATPFIDGTDMNSNFREDSTSANYHHVHLISQHNGNITVGCTDYCHSAHGSILTKPWDSDWNGEGDSDASCPTCHNVHGSNSVVMLRTGELIGQEPGLNIKYLDSASGAPWNFKDPQTLLGSTGGAQDLAEASTPIATLADNGICLMCHGQQVAYYRTPTVAGASAGASHATGMVIPAVGGTESSTPLYHTEVTHTSSTSAQCESCHSH